MFGFKKSVCSPRCYEVIQLEPEEFEKLKRSGTFEAGFFENIPRLNMGTTKVNSSQILDSLKSNDLTAITVLSEQAIRQRRKPLFLC